MVLIFLGIKHPARLPAGDCPRYGFRQPIGTTYIPSSGWQ